MGICCINCFQDDCIIKIIKENEEKGDCEYCGSEDTCCMDTFELTDIFSPLMEIYEETTYGEHYGYGNDPNNCGGLLEDLIQEDWTIFSEGLDSDKAKNLLWDILMHVSVMRMSSEPKKSERPSIHPFDHLYSLQHPSGRKVWIFIFTAERSCTGTCLPIPLI